MSSFGRQNPRPGSSCATIRSASLRPVHLRLDVNVTHRSQPTKRVRKPREKIAGYGVTSRPMMTTIGINCVVKIRLEN